MSVDPFDVKAGDRIRIVAISQPAEELGLTVGEEHVAEYVGRAASGVVYVTLIGHPVALVSNIGDEWAVLEPQP